MLKLAVISLVIAAVLAVLGFGGAAGTFVGIAKILFGLFLVIAIVFVVLAALGVGAARKVLK